MNGRNWVVATAERSIATLSIFAAHCSDRIANKAALETVAAFPSFRLYLTISVKSIWEQISG